MELPMELQMELTLVYCATTSSLHLSKYKNIPNDLHANYTRVYMGAELNTVLKFLISPETPETRSYDQIKMILTEHFDTSKNKYAESIKFRTIVQAKDESIANFSLRLKQGAVFCEFGTFLDRMLIEQLLHGLNDGEICNEVISKKPETFKAAYDIAHSLEATRHTAEQLTTNAHSFSEKTNALLSTPLQVKQNKNHQKKSCSQSHFQGPRNSQNGSSQVQQRQTGCLSCRGTHVRESCRFRHIDCRICKKKGHIAKVCRSRSSNHTNQIVEIGREWLAEFAHEINFASLFYSPHVTSVHSLISTPLHLSAEQDVRLKSLLKRHDGVFSEKVGKLVGPPVKMHLKPGASPVFARARDIPYALHDAYAREIEAKISAGYYVKVDYSEWASPTHVVMRTNGKIRITGDYKPTLNPRIIIDEHPIPKAEHIFNKIKEAKLFCHFDITDGYIHLPVDEEFAHALTLNTPTHGLIRSTRAVYGAVNIPAIWQRRLEGVLQGLENVLNFFDDILLFASSFEELLIILDAVLTKLEQYGLCLNRAKCIFAACFIEFLGHKIDVFDIHKSDKHVEAIRDAPKSSTAEELELFIGKATYYTAFIPDLATIARPLRDMLLVEPFKWTPEAEKAYAHLKSVLISPQVLMSYEPSLPLLLAVDAGKTGLGAALSHKLKNGQGRPIAYASRTLSATEQRYPQIDKEALAIIWGVQKFFYYLYARKFTLTTDHKPLTQILHPEKSLPTLCISRISNYADYLAHFNYTIQFKPTDANKNADYCSRAPLPMTIGSIDKVSVFNEGETKIGLNEFGELDGFDVFMVHKINQLPINAAAIALDTPKNLHLGKIVQLLVEGKNLSNYGYKASEANYILSSNCCFNSTFRTFSPFQKVYFLSGNPRMEQWIPGTIITRLGDLHYEIDHNNKTFKRHIDQIVSDKSQKETQEEAPSMHPQQPKGKRHRRVHFYETVTISSTIPSTPITTPSTPRYQLRSQDQSPEILPAYQPIEVHPALSSPEVFSTPPAEQTTQNPALQLRRSSKPKKPRKLDFP